VPSSTAPAAAAAEVEDEFAKGSAEVSLSLGKATTQIAKGLKAIPKGHAARPQSGASSVVYLGHIPHGFYEEQMKGYFSQFGDVLRLRLSRNKKTGASRHFAFIEFDDAEVARIVAATMNNYLLSNQLLVCHVVPTEKQHPDMFRGADRPFVKVPWVRREIQKRSQKRTPQQVQKRSAKLIQKDAKKRRQLAALGIDYEFPGYSASAAPAKKHQKFRD